MPDPAIGTPPTDVTDELTALSAALDRVVPAKTADNLLVGTWNVRAFDRVTPKWRSITGDSPIRDHSNVACIAEIVSRFDVIAIQEVRRSAAAFIAMLEVLGPEWAFLVTDVTEGAAGNNERLTFVYDTRRLKPSGLACELVVPAAADTGIPTDRLLDQFARTPYAVSFARGNIRFTLVTLHVVYGRSETDRIPELTELANWLAAWAARKDIWGENLMALGDLNIDHQDDPLYRAFTSTGLRPPDGLNFVPRTIFDDPDPTAPPDHRHFYDQIAWFPAGRAKLSLPLINAGTFDFTQHLIPADTPTQLSWRISDHYPLWCEFKAGP
jgi:exonuclease III